MRVMIRLIKNDPRFKITTYSELAKSLESDGERVIKKSDIPSIYASLKNSFFPLQEPSSFSLCDIMLACRDFLLGKDTHKCGDVFGFLDKPYEIKEKLTVSAQDIIDACPQIKDGKFLPEKIFVNGRVIGPADWLFGALEVLLGATSVDILPKPQLPCLDCMPEVRDSDFKGTWQHSDTFEDKYLSDRLRYQSWTMRYRACSRKIRA
jgi:hypothetical protein